LKIKKKKSYKAKKTQ